MQVQAVADSLAAVSVPQIVPSGSLDGHPTAPETALQPEQPAANACNASDGPSAIDEDANKLPQQIATEVGPEEAAIRKAFESSCVEAAISDSAGCPESHGVASEEAAEAAEDNIETAQTSTTEEMGSNVKQEPVQSPVGSQSASTAAESSAAAAAADEQASDVQVPTAAAATTAYEASALELSQPHPMNTPASRVR